MRLSLRMLSVLHFETSRPVSKCSCRVSVHSSPARCESVRVTHARIQALARRIKLEFRCSTIWQELLNIRDHLSSQICGDGLLCAFLKITPLTQPMMMVGRHSPPTFEGPSVFILLVCRSPFSVFCMASPASIVSPVILLLSSDISLRRPPISSPSLSVLSFAAVGGASLGIRSRALVQQDCHSSQKRSGRAHTSLNVHEIPCWPEPLQF